MRKTEIALYMLCIAGIIWIMVSTIDVWINHARETETYLKANLWLVIVPTREIETETSEPAKAKEKIKMVVKEGNPIDDYYEVVVEDYDGNIWSYYDTDFVQRETKMWVTMQDGYRITDATIAEGR